MRCASTGIPMSRAPGGGQLLLDADSRDKDGQTQWEGMRRCSSALNAWNHVLECYAYVKADLTRELPPKYTLAVVGSLAICVQVPVTSLQC